MRRATAADRTAAALRRGSARTPFPTTTARRDVPRRPLQKSAFAAPSTTGSAMQSGEPLQTVVVISGTNVCGGLLGTRSAGGLPGQNPSGMHRGRWPDGAPGGAAFAALLVFRSMAVLGGYAGDLGRGHPVAPAGSGRGQRRGASGTRRALATLSQRLARTALRPQWPAAFGLRCWRARWRWMRPRSWWPTCWPS